MACIYLSIHILKEKVKFHFKLDGCHKQSLESVAGWVIEGGQADGRLMPQPQVAGEREVREEVEEGCGVQEDDRMVGVEGGERRLGGREEGRERRVGEQEGWIPYQRLTSEGSLGAMEIPAVDQSDEAT